MIITNKLELISIHSAKKELSYGGLIPSAFLNIWFKKMLILFLFLATGFFGNQSQAQILKKIGKKIEQKVEQRAERKVDKTIDKGLDKVEEGIDESTRESTKKPEKSSSEVADSKTSAEFIASNQSFLNDDEPYSLQEAETVKLKDGMVMVSGDCNDFIWFKQGAEMHFETTDFAGKKKSVESSKMVVNKVFSEKGKRIAEVNMTSSTSEDFDMDMRFICSGNNLYMDISSAMKQALAKSGQANTQSSEAVNNIEMGFGDGFMDIPKNMYPGQKLKDVHFTLKTNTTNMNMVINSNLVDRSVGPKEKVVTPAGTFDCMPITGTRKSSMKVMGINNKMGGATKEIVWMAPGIGLVKSETYDAKGKLGSSQVLTKLVK